MFEEAQEPARSEWPARQSDSGENRSARPLADRLRPTEFGDFMGQEKLVGQNAPLRRLIDGNRVPSMILWGPPGSGKTTLASLIARTTDSDFITLSAVTSGIKDVRGVIDIAKVNRQYARKTILFIDEIHRFNKAQQDAFLPHVESGLITLIGATTENPSFSVIAPLLSRCRVFTLAAIEDTHLVQLLQRAVPELNEVEEEPPIEVESEALDAIVQLSDGDARRALGILEIAADVAREQHAEAEAAPITRDDVVAVVQRHLMYDRGGEEHFNLISALHKTIRSSDPHGALYWCERMLAGGEDPRFILRRLIRAASEDVGLAAPNALVHAVACLDAFEKIGQPEGNIFVSQLAVALAMAPKSNAIYMASKRTAALIQETGTLPVPLHLRNAPTGLMKSEGYSDGYTYDHDEAGHFVPKQGLPDELEGTALYEPTDQGQEARLQERLSELDAARAEERAARKKP
ncbi:replication-associated recombination protein A [bacterium]|nr:replication-associated recombination protein A [bacterium]